MILSTMKNNLIEAGLWIDDMIYSLISLVYSLINKLAQYQVFTSEDITSFSRRVYILLGIFMLFKLTFSMITYLVNPDQFSDKSKGFGGMIKNVMISMILMVTVPYIFSEAYYVQKMILEDGTLIKVIFPKGGEAGSNTSYGYVNDTAGEDIKFILFSQFIKPNTNIIACKTLYEYDDKGERLVNEDGILAINEECKSALDEAFDKQELLNFYVDGMTYQSYDLLTSEPEIYTKTFKTTDKRGKEVKKEVITYHWLISTIVGIVTLLALTTICLDVALRSIKLGLYQIIAPIPIISNCDPKAGKDGMLQKWIKACVSTYVDLFIRLFILYLGLYLIITLVNNMKFDGIASVILIIGVLMFVKQFPKILQDLTGLKVDGFTLNPFKKIKNEIPESLSKGLHQARLRATGAAGGFLAGMVGGGRNFGQNLLSAGMGSIRGAVKGKGFAAGLNAQADVNRKIRDARINGASFLGGVGAAVASTFGLDNADLEKKATEVNNRRGASRKLTESYDLHKKANDAKISRTKNDFAGVERRRKSTKSLSDAFGGIRKYASGEIDKGKAGLVSDQASRISQSANTLKQMAAEGRKADHDFTYTASERYTKADGTVDNHLVTRTVKAGSVITDSMAKEAEDAIGLYKNKNGLADYTDILLHEMKGYVPKTRTVTTPGYTIKEKTGLLDANGNEMTRDVFVAGESHLEYERDSSGKIIYEEASDKEKFINDFTDSQGQFVAAVNNAEQELSSYKSEYKDYKEGSFLQEERDDDGNITGYYYEDADGKKHYEISEIKMREDELNIDFSNLDSLTHSKIKKLIDGLDADYDNLGTTLKFSGTYEERLNEDNKNYLRDNKVVYKGEEYDLETFNNETDSMDKEVKREQERRKPNYDSANANNPFR